MRLPGFLSPLPKDKTKREADIVEDESKADPTAQPLMVSGTDLRTGPSSLKNPKSGGTQTPSSWTTRLTIPSCKIGGYYGRIKSVFRKKQIHTDVLPSLNSVAEGLCDILEHCDVSSSPLYHATHDAHDCPRKRRGIAIRWIRFYSESNGWRNWSTCPLPTERSGKKREGRS